MDQELLPVVLNDHLPTFPSEMSEWGSFIEKEQACLKIMKTYLQSAQMSKEKYLDIFREVYVIPQQRQHRKEAIFAKFNAVKKDKNKIPNVK